MDLQKKQYKYTVDGRYLESYKNIERFSDEIETAINSSDNIKTCDCYNVMECSSISINGKKEEKCKKYLVCNSKCKK
jgi:hypothetical protein